MTTIAMTAPQLPSVVNAPIMMPAMACPAPFALWVRLCVAHSENSQN